jgi:hypothetical protein
VGCTTHSVVVQVLKMTQTLCPTSNNTNHRKTITKTVMKLNRVYIQHTADIKNLYLSNQFFTQIHHITRTTDTWDQNLCSKNTGFMIHLLPHTNKCTNYIIYYLKSVLTIDIKTLSYFHSSYMFRHIKCHPQGALMFLAKITGKQFVKHEHILCEGCGSIS